MQGAPSLQPLCKHFVIKINHLRHLYAICGEINYTKFNPDWMSGRFWQPETESREIERVVHETCSSHHSKVASRTV